MKLCTKPEHAHLGEHGHLSMPDPCPHVTRLDLIAARLNDTDQLIDILDHLDHCTGS